MPVVPRIEQLLNEHARQWGRTSARSMVILVGQEEASALPSEMRGTLEPRRGVQRYEFHHQGVSYPLQFVTVPIPRFLALGWEGLETPPSLLHEVSKWTSDNLVNCLPRREGEQEEEHGDVPGIDTFADAPVSPPNAPTASGWEFQSQGQSFVMYSGQSPEPSPAPVWRVTSGSSMQFLEPTPPQSVAEMERDRMIAEVRRREEQRSLERLRESLSQWRNASATPASPSTAARARRS